MSTFTKTLKAQTITATLLMVAASTLSCGSASAMARSSSPQVAAPASSLPVILDPASRSGGSFDNGYQLGLRNGGILSSRLKQRTTDQQGCGAVDQLQDALLKVSRTLRPPLNSDDALVSGFYSGYLDSIRGTLAEVRDACGIGQYTSGEYAGELYGAVACQVQSISIDALSGLELKPLYSGWSGGSSTVQSSCKSSLRATIQSCSSSAELSTTIEAAILISCSDET
jgi:hypothetical protein